MCLGMNPIGIATIRLMVWVVAMGGVIWPPEGIAATINRPWDGGEVGYATADPCWVCKQPLVGKVYTVTDKVTNKPERICGKCASSPHSCHVCGLPVTDNGVDLNDTRFVCERDALTVMLDARAIQALCAETKDALDAQLSRFLTLPPNVNFSAADRKRILDLARAPGGDSSCPNDTGYMRRLTGKQGDVSFSISILYGQSRAATIATCTHELGHAWAGANLSPLRIQRLSQDAAEGFCDLLAYLRLRELGETREITNLRSNLYSHGQLDLFIAAEKNFGLNSVLDWMRDGRHDRLSGSEPWRVQDLVARTNKSAPNVGGAQVSAGAGVPQPVVLPERLVLKSVSLGGRTPLAMINQCTLTVGETGRVRLAHTNLNIRCLAIRADSVTVEVVGTGERQELRFEPRAGAK